MGKIIAIANQKGGVGKTTTAINLGAALVKRGENILLVDMDSQANCSKGLGVYLKGSDTSIRDVLEKPDMGVASITKETALDGLSIAPSHIYLAKSELALVIEVDGAYRLSLALESVIDEYDRIIIDSPPSLGILAANCLLAAREVIIPMEAEPYTLDGMDALEETIESAPGRTSSMMYPCLAFWLRHSDAEPPFTPNCSSSSKIIGKTRYSIP